MSQLKQIRKTEIVLNKIIALEKAKGQFNPKWHDLVSIASQVPGVYAPSDLINIVKRQILMPETSIQRKVELNEMLNLLINNKKLIEKLEKEY